MPPKAKASPAAYAQDKRDKEVEARNQLDHEIPQVYFHGDIAKDNTTYNPSTRVMKAAKDYIEKLEEERDAAHDQLNQHNMTRSPTTAAIAPPNVLANPDIANLKQGARRCLAKAEQKMAEAGGLTGELKEVIGKGYELFVDITDMLEQGGMSQEQKRKWAEEQEQWGRRFNLQ